MSNPQQQDQVQSDPGGDALTAVVVLAFKVVVALLLLPLLIPLIVVAVSGEIVATKTRFWLVSPWRWAINTAGVLLVVGLLVVEVLLVVQWVSSGDAEAFRTAPDWADQILPTFLPWAIANLASGVLLIPVALSAHRRRIARRVRTRRISDVLRQTQIEQARKRAADTAAARRVGVQLDAETGAIARTTDKALTAPLSGPGGRWGFGFVSRATVKNLEERFYDVRRVRDWTDTDGKLMMLPAHAASVRALLVAESGTGKTVLLSDLMLCALEAGWPVVFIDAKGDPADAEKLQAVARTLGRTAEVGGRWNLFTGTADQITSKLMRLMPPPDGANQYYLNEIRGVLQVVQSVSPVSSVDDLRERLTRPENFIDDRVDLGIVLHKVDRDGTTAGERALSSLLVELRPLQQWIGPDGWSYANPQADIRIVPLSPISDTQARLGDLLLLDLRNYLATRLEQRDKTPTLVVVDEFPQLVTGATDPGDTATSLYETARSAGMGLILVAQSVAGLSRDEISRRRALSSGAALIFGRSKDPEDVVQYAGTVMQMEASGAATGEELKSGRAQHTFLVPPQDVREAADGAFWIVQAGGIAPFRALPTRQATPTPPPQFDPPVADEVESVEGDVDPVGASDTPNTVEERS
ncbi:hypothetical protein SCB71_21290 (plasmid) [Herbiconiux sp. KACC 21604]|uniref:hypothetical protein n=1 Tax=unclassified Herbiconiux TaxID=2618217 RepID=UPI001492BA67|nr:MULTISPECIES: hypothetical protein [unclassified Herbiconiux]QJU56281.1 hypothetical protein HL652_21090 [Herbiconiux sp. SALV-R1]WPO88785.1 hypothetical protein SCB71_21290 [Herbiconiux sp. KACC 21604]